MLGMSGQDSPREARIDSALLPTGFARFGAGTPGCNMRPADVFDRPYALVPLFVSHVCGQSPFVRPSSTEPSRARRLQYPRD